MQATDLQSAVTISALVMSVLCFLLFLWLSFKAQQARPSEPARQMAEKARGLTPVSLGELTDFTKALASLGETLVKAGPTVTTLLGAILFLTIATVGSGVVTGKPAPSPTATTSK